MTFPRHLRFINGRTLTTATLRNPEFWSEVMSLSGGFAMTKEQLTYIRSNPRPLYIPIASAN